MSIGSKRTLRAPSKKGLKLMIVAVVVSLIMCINITISSSAQLDYAFRTGRLPAHAIAEVSLDRFEDYKKEVEGISGIDEMEYLLSPGLQTQITVGGSVTYSSDRYSCLGLSGSSEKIQSLLGYQPGNIEAGTAALTGELAELLGAVQGDQITFSVMSRFSNESRDMSLTIATILGERDGSISDLMPPEIAAFRAMGILTNASDLARLLLPLSSFQTIDLYLWYEPALASDPSNIKNVYAIEAEIKDRQMATTPILYSYLPVAFSDYKNHESERRSEQTMLALPVVFFSLYFCYKASSSSALRDDYKLLSTRGMSRRQFLTSYIIDWGVVGGVAGILGYLIGVFVSFAMATFLVPGSPAVVDYMMIDNLPPSILLALALSCSIGLLEFLSMFRAKEDRRSTRFYAGLLALSLVPFLSILLDHFADGDDLVAYAVQQLIAFSLPLSIVSSVLFIVGLCGVLLHADRRLLSGLAMLYRRVLKELHHLFVCRIRRVEKKDQHLAIIAALLVAYIVFSSALFSSMNDFSVREDLIINGADIKITNLQIATGIDDFEERLSGMGNVEASTLTYTSSSRIYGKDVQVVGLNKTSYANTVRSVEADSLSKIGGPEDVIITRDLSDALYIGEGDIISIRMYETGSESMTYNVMAIVGALPGFIGSDSISGPVLQVYMQLDHWNITGRQPSNALLRLQADAEPNTVINELRPLLEEGKFSTLESQREEQDTILFNRVETAFLTLAAIVGIAGTSFNSLAERSTELACLRSKGISKRRLATFVMSETTLMLAIGMIVGLAGGILSSIMTVSILNSRLSAVSNVIDYAYVLSPEGLIALVVVAAVVMIATLVVLNMLFKRLRVLTTHELEDD